MSGRRVGAYFLTFFFMGIPITCALWLWGIWIDDPVKEQNFYQTAGVATFLTVAFGFLGGIMSAD